MVVESVLMKLGDVKRALGVSREQVYGMAKRGEIKRVRVGSQMMYERRSVNEWMRAQNVEGGL